MKIAPNLLHTLTLSTLLATQAYAAGPRPPVNPSIGLDGSAAMHSDSAASDTTYLPGTGNGNFKSELINLNGVCATVVLTRDGFPISICTDYSTLSPVVSIIDPDEHTVIDRLIIGDGSVMGGIYAYINQLDQVVIADGTSALLILNTKDEEGNWALSNERRINLSPYIPKGEAINAVNPAADGSIWFVTDQGLVGRFDPEIYKVDTHRLKRGETVNNSFANSGDGKVAVATNNAVYLLEYKKKIKEIWRQKYDSGSHRKPGKLSHGTGSSPTFFGPIKGTEYLTIADNADSGDNLLIFNTENKKSPLVCKVELPSNEVFGSENSPIGVGNSVILTSSYGYPFPIEDTLPPAIPATAPLGKGMYRVDVVSGNKKSKGNQCELIWSNPVQSSAVPKLSVSDDYIYTFERIDEQYYYTVIDFLSGETVKKEKIGSGFMYDTQQLAGNMGFKQTFWQGSNAGIIKISPEQKR
ncbi:hypothetical protein [Endozoicomonas numazuensis]|uniref:Uncharacterized protein n=1 Tax=Endozoicomonas numazuensis TaxID=1137799 RepID=A0A081N6E5_9GAMM|nr:hypothetical protein [Endozoicomonas numazuensis]KEQ14018.1 hypothetical protein GZ78_25600 [Endozoicomonas numazuensis]